jgi:hypothetical protein
LVAAPALLYLVAMVGGPPWSWILGVLLAGGIAWLGLAVLRGRTAPWFVLTTVMILILPVGILELVGVIDGAPLWLNVVDLVLGGVVLQALVAACTKPGGDVWAEMIRQWPLILTGLVVMVSIITLGGRGDDAEDMPPVDIILGLALAIWAFVMWRAVRRFKSQKDHLPSGSTRGAP